MILNIVNKSLNTHNCLSDSLAQACQGDAILLIENGVLAAVDSPANQAWTRGCEDVELYVLAEDIRARGLEDKLLPCFHTIDYAGFVDLVARFPLSQSWY